MRITLCARSKILKILEPGSSFRVQATGSMLAGLHVDLIQSSKPVPGDVTISHTPHVIADLSTVTALAGKVVDFDYTTDEFVISDMVDT